MRVLYFADAGSDYVIASGTIEFNAQTVGGRECFDITINTDAIREPPETFTVIIFNFLNNNDLFETSAMATVTIADSGGPPTRKQLHTACSLSNLI